MCCKRLDEGKAFSARDLAEVLCVVACALRADKGQFLVDLEGHNILYGLTGARVQVRNPYPPEKNFPLHEERFEDKWFIVDFVGQYAAHPWGLKDIIGNVSEWTRSSYRPYPYDDQDGRNDGSLTERKVARGGSWHSRPREAGSAVRLPYESYQPVHDVGFRVIIDD